MICGVRNQMLLRLRTATEVRLKKLWGIPVESDKLQVLIWVKAMKQRQTRRDRGLK
jgi:hypothetical protein